MLLEKIFNRIKNNKPQFFTAFFSGLIAGIIYKIGFSKYPIDSEWVAFELIWSLFVAGLIVSLFGE